jgi:hypothetical protein
MATEHPSVTILILNWNGRQVVPRCLSALEALDYPDLRIVVADNGSADDSLAYIRDNHPQVEVIELGHNMGFARGNNAGFARLAHKSDLLVLLNTDVYVRPGWLTALVQPFSRPDTGVSGAKLLFLDEKHIQHAGGEMGYPLAISRHIGYQELDDGQPEDEQEVPYVTGASLAIRWSLAQELGLFDEQFAPYYYEEADLCARVWQAGYKVIYVPQAVAVHHESLSAVKGSPQSDYAYHINRLRYVLKHYTDQQLINDFIPAELVRLQTVPHSAEGLESIRRVYLETMLEVSAAVPSERKRIVLAALGQWWETSLRVDPEHVPRFIYDKPLLDPVFRKVQAGWRAFATKVLFWPTVKRQRAANALIWRLAMQLSQIDADEYEPEEVARQIDALRQELEEIGR